MTVLRVQPAIPIGRYKTFGPYGPLYEVGQVIGPIADGDWLIEVTVVTTGERVEYPLSQLREDPDAQ